MSIYLNQNKPTWVTLMVLALNLGMCFSQGLKSIIFGTISVSWFGFLKKNKNRGWIHFN